jgi:renalase
MAGLAAASTLAAQGHRVTLFDKGRGPGGRMSTRRVTTAGGEISFDHGAQFFTARDPAFVSAIKALASQGVVAPWDGVVRKDGTGNSTPLSQDTLWVGVPGMNAVVRALATDHNVSWGVRVLALQRHDAGWQVETAEGLKGPFDQVIIAVPAEQVSDLVQPFHADFAAQASSVQSEPCWAAMLAFDRPISLPSSALQLDDHPVLGFVSQNHSKPGRADMPALVVHATPAWSAAHLEDDAIIVAQALSHATSGLVDGWSEPMFLSAHRWRYARVGKVQGDRPIQRALWDVELGLGVCGDWLLGPRIECAFLSGHHLGQMIAADMTGSATRARH